MIIFFILGLLLGGVAVVFALQNVTIITVNFFYSQITGSLALILISAILAGMFITLFALFPKLVSDHFTLRKFRKEAAKLEEELRRQKVLTVFAKDTPPTPEIIDGIEKGATMTRSEYQQ